ncbi:hypothetical protein ACROYT_G025889 [Oculina patagonica]
MQEDGVYQCVAESKLGMIVSSTWVHVRATPPKFVEFGPFYLYNGYEARLKCQPEAAPPPVFRWYKNGSQIINSPRHRLLSDGTLVIHKVIPVDAGYYRCSAKNFLNEVNATAPAYVLAVPYTPSNLKITDTCHNRTTTLSWITMASDATIMYFLVEQESNHEPNIFKLIFNVTDPNATSVILNLTGWATLRFRVIAVTNLGLRFPSFPTEAGICITSPVVPDKFPDNLKGVPTKSEDLNITWTPMPKVDWNAPGLYYILQYRKVKGEAHNVWKEENITDPSIGTFSIPGQCEVWEFRIRAGNEKGLGPFSAIENASFVFGKPERVDVENITVSSVQVAWTPVAVPKGGSIDGYRIYYWTESQVRNEKRRRRAIPNYATFTNVTGGKTQQATVDGLKPFTDYNLVIKAFSCGGEGPSSDVVTFSTIGAGRSSIAPTASSTRPGNVSNTPTASSARPGHAFFTGVLAFVLVISNILCHF